LNYLTWIAQERGLQGFRAEIVDINPKMRHLMAKCFKKFKEQDLGPDGVMITALFSNWRGNGNPVWEKQAAAASAKP
jgi:hypothetical protein